MRLTRPRGLLSLATAALLGITLLAANGGATAEPSPPPVSMPLPVPVPVIVKESDESADLPRIEVAALARDLRQLGDTANLTLNDLVERRKFGAVVSDFEKTFPENYFGAGMPADESDAYWIMLKNEPDETQLAALAGLPVDVEVRSGAVASEAEFDVAVGQLSAALTKEFTAAAGLAVGPAANGSSIEVRFDEQSIAADAIESIATKTLGDAIPVSLVSGGPIELTVFAQMEGGRQLRGQSMGATVRTTTP